MFSFYGFLLRHSLKEAFIEECELIRADMLENTLEVTGEFVTEQCMREEWNWSELLSCF